MPSRVMPASPIHFISAPLAAACGRPKTPAAPGFPSPMRASPSARSAPSPSPRRIPMWSTSVPARPISAASTPTAPACINPSTRARLGPTSASTARARSDAWRWIRRIRIAFTQPRWATSTPPTRTGACIAHSMVEPPGRRCFSRTTISAPSISPSIPKTRACSTRPSGQRAVRHGRSTRRATCPAAGCTSPPTAATRGSS